MRAPALAVCLLGTVLISGCTTTTGGTALPSPDGDGTSTEDTTTSQSSPPDDLPRNGAPKVKNPLELQRFQKDACLVLTSAQSQELDLGTAGAPTESAFGSQCLWKNDANGSDAQVLILDKVANGLSGFYGAHQDGELEVFEELPPIAGYPAIIGMSRDTRDLGDCTISVGLRDDLAINVSVKLSRVNVGKKDPCDVTARVAGMAIETIKNG